MIVLTLTERLSLVCAAALTGTATIVWTIDTTTAKRVRRQIRGIMPPAKARKLVKVKVANKKCGAWHREFKDGVFIQ